MNISLRYLVAWKNAVDRNKFPTIPEKYIHRNITYETYLKKMETRSMMTSSLSKCPPKEPKDKLCLNCANVRCSMTCLYTRYLKKRDYKYLSGKV